MTQQTLLHVGFGKTGTSHLQQYVFPKFAMNNNIGFWGNECETSKARDPNLTKLIAHNLACMLLGKKVTSISFSEPTLVSAEGFSSYRDLARIREYAMKTRDIFNPETHILLTLREPREWLTSLYVQRCIHENPVQPPEAFFLSATQASKHLPNAYIELDNFSYRETIDAWREFFAKVTVVKFEALPEMQFLSHLTRSSNSAELAEYQQSWGNISNRNKAITENSINVIFKYQKILSLFNLDYKNKYNNVELLKRSSEEFKNGSFQRLINTNGLRATIIRAFDKLNYKTFCTNGLDRIFPSKKYMVPDHIIGTRNLKRLTSEYNELPLVKTFQ